MEHRTTRILVGTRDCALRYCLEALAAGDPEIALILVNGDSDEITNSARELLPDVIVIDTIGARFDVVRLINALAPTTNVVLLGEDSRLNDVLLALAAGVKGYFHRSMPVEQILPAIKAVIGGKVVIETSIAKAAQHYFAHPLAFGQVKVKGSPEKLTRREIEILHRIAEGSRDKMIAAELGLSVRTVKAHITSAMAKMGVHTRSGAVAVGIRQGLLPRD